MELSYGFFANSSFALSIIKKDNAKKKILWIGICFSFIQELYECIMDNKIPSQKVL